MDSGQRGSTRYSDKLSLLSKRHFPRLGAWEFGLWPPVGGLGETSAKTCRNNEAISTSPSSLPTNATKAEALASMSASFERFCLAAWLEALAEMMEQEALAACGERHERGRERRHHGSDRSDHDSGCPFDDEFKPLLRARVLICVVSRQNPWRLDKGHEQTAFQLNRRQKRSRCAGPLQGEECRVAAHFHSRVLFAAGKHRCYAVTPVRTIGEQRVPRGSDSTLPVI